MHDDVKTVLERALDKGCRERVVAHAQEPVAPGDLCNRPQIHDLQKRIGRRLHPQEARGRANRLFEHGQVGEIRKGDVVTGGALAHILKNPVAAAVEIMHRDDVRTGIEELQNRRDGGHAGGEGEARMARLEICDRGLQGIARRIGGTRVLIAFVHAGACLHVGRGGVDRRHDRPRQGIGSLPTVDDAGGKGVLGILVTHTSTVCLRRSQFKRSMRVTSPRKAVPSMTIATMPRLKTSIKLAIGASAGTVMRRLTIAFVTGSLKCSGFENTFNRISSSSTMPTMLPSRMTGSCETS